MNLFPDISPDFKPSKLDASIMAKVIPREATPKAIRVFSNVHRPLSDYGYWFLLGTLWVSYTGWSDLDLWKRFFRSDRPNRRTSLMKPSELRALDAMPESFSVYRAHRPDETDWIAYTFNPERAAEFAVRRGVEKVAEYRINRADVLALFLRRGEDEVLVLDREKATFRRWIEIRVASKA